jgi:hypothetical protein
MAYEVTVTLRVDQILIRTSLNWYRSPDAAVLIGMLERKAKQLSLPFRAKVIALLLVDSPERRRKRKGSNLAV